MKGLHGPLQLAQPIPSESWVLIHAGTPTAVLGKATWNQLAFPLAHPMDQTVLFLQLGSPALSACGRS